MNELYKVWTGGFSDSFIKKINDISSFEEKEIMSGKMLELHSKEIYVEDIIKFIRHYAMSLLSSGLRIPRISYEKEFQEFSLINLENYSDMYFNLKSNVQKSLRKSLISSEAFARAKITTKNKLKHIYEEIDKNGWVSVSYLWETLNIKERYNTRRFIKYFTLNGKEMIIIVTHMKNKYLTWKYEDESFEKLNNWLLNKLKITEQARKQSFISNNNFSSCSESNNRFLIEEQINNAKEKNSQTNELVSLLTSCLKKGKLSPRSFPYLYFKNTLQFLQYKDSRGFRWESEFMIFAKEIIYAIGKNKYDSILRGHVIEKESNGNFLPCSENFNFLLPSSETVDNWFSRGSSYNSQYDKNMLKKLTNTVNCTNVFALMVDATDLIPQINLCRKEKKLYGMNECPHDISLIDNYLDRELSTKDFTRKVLQSMISSVDNQIHWPSLFKFINAENKSIITNLINEVVELHSGIHIKILVVDSLISNWSYIRSNPLNLRAFICYEHLLKIYRNQLEHSIYMPITKSITGNISIHTNLKYKFRDFNYIKLLIDIELDIKFYIIVQFKDLNEKKILVSVKDKKLGNLISLEGIFISLFDDKLCIICMNMNLIPISYITISNLNENLINISKIEMRSFQVISLKLIQQIWLKDSEFWSKLIPKNSLWAIPKQDTYYAVKLCSEEVISALKIKYPHYLALHTYLKMMNCIYYKAHNNNGVTSYKKDIKYCVSVINDWWSCIKMMYSKFNGLRIFVSKYAHESVKLNLDSLEYVDNQDWKNNFHLHTLCTNALEGFFGQSKTNRLMKKHSAYSYSRCFDSITTNYLIKSIVSKKYNSPLTNAINEVTNKSLTPDQFTNTFKRQKTSRSDVSITSIIENKVKRLIDKYQIAKTKSLRETFHKPQYISQQLLNIEVPTEIENYFVDNSLNMHQPLFERVEVTNECFSNLIPNQNEVSETEIPLSKDVQSYYGTIKKIPCFKRDGIMRFYFPQVTTLPIMELMVYPKNGSYILIDLEEKELKMVGNSKVIEFKIPHSTSFHSKAIFKLKITCCSIVYYSERFKVYAKEPKLDDETNNSLNLSCDSSIPFNDSMQME
jgi:hypothetical protein